ncbi:MAG: MMPL family transporter [Actinomycetota bacterium]|nr:MMPL family transporter [Actinomycetota bacterium]
MHRKNLAARAARWSAAHRKTAIFGWLAFVVVAVIAGGMVGQNQIHGADQFSGEAGRAERTLEDAGLRPNSESVLIQSKRLTTEDREFRTAVDQLVSRLSKSRHVKNVVSPLTGGGAVSADKHAALVDFEITGDDLEAQDRLEPAKDAVADVQDAHEGMRVEQFGNISSSKELQETFTEDLLKAETLSFPLTLAILVIAFGSLMAALVPLAVGFTAVMAAMSLVAIPSQLSPVDSNISSVILLIGLAVGVDYSLFYLRREREERAAGREPRSALEVAAATSGHAVLISGLTVMAAMAGMFLSGDKTFFSFAEGTILVVAIAMFASLTVLPALLAWLGDRVEKGRIPFLGRRRRAGESRLWSAIVERVMRRPWLSIAVAGGLLVALAIPALGMKIVVSSVDDLPKDLAVIQTYDRLRDAFPAEGVTVDVALKGDDLRTGAAAAGISELRQRAERSKGVLGPPEATYSADGTAALISIPTGGNGNDAKSTSALEAIRDRVIPGTVGEVDGVATNVTGNAAQSKDFRDLLTSRLPLIFGFVFALTFMLMLVTFRSIVIPIKAILLNLLSVGAAYGVLVLVFQEGWGEGLLGFTSNGGVTSWLPLFLFVILFGLSMDYHVFILSRVREAFQAGMSTAEAVRHGISTTAGTVTSAAIVMVVVFSVFVTLSFLDFKQMGVGLAVAVLIDATIVRGVLLPASMKVLGDWNWYLPSWLEWIPQARRELQDGEPAAEPAKAPAGSV